MLKLNNLSKKYILTDKSEIQALEDINLSFDKAGFICIVGKSGSGKSTLLNLIGGIDKATKGTITVSGKDLTKFKHFEYDYYRNHQVGFVSQDYNLLPEYTVGENIKIAIKLQEKNGKMIHLRMLDALRKVELLDCSGRKITELSGGQQQRIAIARALAKNYEIILCDEPTGNLDGETALEIIKLLKDISKTKLIIMVTHDESLAKDYADRIIRLEAGHVSQDVSQNSGDMQNINENKMKQTSHLGVKSIIRFVWGNIKRSYAGSLTILLILITTLTLFTNFYSLSKFDSERALLNTLDERDEIIIPITKHIDRTYLSSLLSSNISLQQKFDKSKIKESDYEEILNLINNKLDILKGYYLNINLQDFIGGNLQVDNPDNFYAKGFTEYIKVPDFNKLNQQLLFGKNPVDKNEVLIYDYMAQSLIEYGVVSTKDMGTLIGEILTDTDTGLSIKIAGILKSNFKEYENTDLHFSNYIFPLYLSGLQTIFCKPEFAEVAEINTNVYSISNIHFNVYEEDEIYFTQNSNTKKLFPSSGFNNLDFIGDFNKNDNVYGIILSTRQFSEIYGISESQIDDKFVNSKLESIYAEVSIESMPFQNYVHMEYLNILGVYKGEDNGKILYWINSPNTFLNINNSFNQFHLLLSDNQDDNYNALKALRVVKQSEEFYKSGLSDPIETFTVYTPYTQTLHGAENYITGIGDMGNRITIIVGVFSMLGICFFTYTSIRKNKYKIGVLKSLGTPNSDISVIFGVEIILIALTAFFISVFTSNILINSINYDFVKNLELKMTFFKINSGEIFISFCLCIITVIISTLFPLIKLLLTPPAKIIRNSKVK